MASTVSFNWLIATIALVIHAKPIAIEQNPKILGISTDTRTLKTGNLFFALSGENFDGHRFVERAIALGAVAVVVSETWFDNYKGIDNNSCVFLVVRDVLRAYQDLAHWWRSQCDVKIIAITGSAGKTTTKEIIGQLLSFYGKVHKSVANHNNDIGVAQTLLAINPDHNFVVVEMGMRGLGEIARLSEMAAPDVAVITNIGTAHIGRLGSQVAIAQAKCELLKYMPVSSVAVLNGEDRLLLETASGVWQSKTLTYGLTGISDEGVQGELDDRELRIGSQSWHLPLSGRHNALNFLAGLAVVKALGLDWTLISKDIGDLDLPEGRSQIYHLPRSVTILDETYNSSPEAAIAALHLLVQTPTVGKRWAVLGAMKELGAKSQELHALVGKTAKDLDVDCLLVLVDGESDAILKGAGNDFNYVDGVGDRSELAKILLNLVRDGDTILYKASHSIGMDIVVRDFQAGWH
jgi:UDP-N-acetylmuramoyl-tripeptide--D-alanyl-D-alanine ligase